MSGLLRINEETGIPIVLTNDAHYIKKSDAESQDVLLCIQTGKTLDEPDRMRFEGSEFYLKTEEEMASILPERPDAIENTVKIAEMCDFDFEFGSLEPNSRYVLSLWTKGPSIYLSYSVMTDITPVDGARTWSTTTSTDEWQELRVEFTTDANPNLDNNWSFYLKRAATNVTEDTYVDNIFLTKKQTAATGITLDKTAVEIEVDENITLTASVTPEGAEMPTVNWASQNESIATVNNGKVTGVAVGTTTVTATAEGLTPVVCTVTLLCRSVGNSACLRCTKCSA